MFKECRSQCDKLTVFLQTNPQLDRPEKNKPIQSVYERFRMLKAIKFIDEVIVYETEQDLYDLLSELKPDVRFVGADWEGKEFTGKYLSPIVYNSRNHRFSSSELRARVASAYFNDKDS